MWLHSYFIARSHSGHLNAGGTSGGVVVLKRACDRASAVRRGDERGGSGVRGGAAGAAVRSDVSGAFAARVTRRRASRTTASGGVGLTNTPFAPARLIRSNSFERASDVTTRMGTERVAASRRRMSHSARPSTIGKRHSVM